ncbi:hypothetical protein KGQ19_34410 [Catenulispora sp. NL8]|uniref:Glycosyltransferase RgtA/B/C/D-like domain-containing protein n=1 Tax=Catenulispora pinistramenti TaxID=2705254 RepID=A0ABS5L1E8_9ACTN|nr:hypothetical protein [Catenulispora pinistramenti]MBS2551970.1 hypothetical protein [Catenulispora pinistramenti]
MSVAILQHGPDRRAKPSGTSADRPGMVARPDRNRRIVFWAVAVLASILLFIALYEQARTVSAHSDGAGFVLQAQDILHGNLLLHGWTVSDVTFYTTELPEYMLVELVRGVNDATVATASALTYTIIVILSVIAATGGSTGRERWIRGGLVVAALIAPATTAPVEGTLLTSPDHFGTAVPILAAFIVLDRIGKRRAVPYVIGAMLAVFGMGDQLVLLVGAIPLAIVCAVRCRRPGPERRFDATLAICAAAAVPVSLVLVRLVHALGGYTSINPQFTLIDVTDITTHATLTAKCMLTLYSADPAGLPPGFKLAMVCYHLVAVAIAGYGVVFVLRRLGRHTRLEEAMAVGVVVNLAAFMFTTMSTGDVFMGREIAMVLPLGTVLAARVVGSRLARIRRSQLGVACCVALSAMSLTVHATEPSVQAEGHDVGSWLRAHKLSHGLGGYWRASVITMSTGGRVQVRAVVSDGRKVAGDLWESKTQWYSQRSTTANFVVIDPRPEMAGYGTEAEAVATFGKPKERVVLDDGIVLVWDHNIMTDLKHLKRS